jgi:hypothetical protein
MVKSTWTAPQGRLSTGASGPQVTTRQQGRYSPAIFIRRCSTKARARAATNA